MKKVVEVKGSEESIKVVNNFFNEGARSVQVEVQKDGVTRIITALFKELI